MGQNLRVGFGNPVPDWLLDVLRYVDLVDLGEGQLTDAQVDVFAAAPPPLSPGEAIPAPSTNGVPAPAAGVAYGSTSWPRVGAYLRRLGWADSTDRGVRLTDLGRAVLHGSDVLSIRAQDVVPDEASGVGRRFEG
jgi:hypothetical protein